MLRLVDVLRLEAVDQRLCLELADLLVVEGHVVGSASHRGSAVVVDDLHAGLVGLRLDTGAGGGVDRVDDQHLGAVADHVLRDRWRTCSCRPGRSARRGVSPPSLSAFVSSGGVVERVARSRTWCREGSRPPCRSPCRPYQPRVPLRRCVGGLSSLQAAVMLRGRPTSRRRRHRHRHRIRRLRGHLSAMSRARHRRRWSDGR